jgi:ubiquinone biosynthesis accessory factor UbiJ
MLHTLNSLLAPAVMERLTLVINHVLAAEAVATERLKPHAGRTVEVAASGWPSLLPAPPALAFRVTPAGLLEWCGLEAIGVADLGVRVDASNPALLLARALGGDMPPLAVEGDALLAGDVNWLLQNLRWDVAADLERIVGPTLAQPLYRLGSALAQALRAAVLGAGELGSRLRPRA